jgi:hypothetical protein
METKELSNEFLDFSLEEMEFIKNVKELLKSIVEKDFDIHSIHVGIGFFSVNIYDYPYSFDIELKSDYTMAITKDVDKKLKIKIENIEVYNNIIDKINEKIEKNVYISVNVVKQEKKYK